MSVTVAGAVDAHDPQAPAAASVTEAPAAAGAAPGALLMSIGTLGSGVMAYGFNVVVAQTLGPDAYGPVAVLWAAMFLAAIVLFRPIEQTLSREISEALVHGRATAPLLASVGRIAGVIALVAAVACAAAWRPITDGLFDGQGILTAMLIVGIAGYGLSYFVRGVVGGHRWYAGYGVLLLADGAVRLALVLPLFAIASVSLAGAALAAAAVAGAVAPLLLRDGRGLFAPLRDRGAGAAAGAAPPTGRLARFAGPLGLVALGDQVLLSGGPVLVMLHGGEHASKAAGVVFAATMLVRAPAYLFQGVSAALLPNLTTMLARSDHAGFRRAVGRTVGILAAFSGVAALGAFAVGPAVMHLLYGAGFDATRGDLALLAVGAGGYLVAGTLSQAALARSEAVATAAIWIGSAAAFVGAELALGGSALHRVAIAFTVAAVANGAAFGALALRSAGRRPDGGPALRLARSEA